MKIETKCLHEGYTPKSGEPRVVPIYQSTTYYFDSAEHVAELFDMPTEYIYSRFANPTVDAVEKKIAALEGGVAAMCTSSGQAASLISILNLCKSGDSFITTSAIYGGTVNLFAVTLKKLGIECIFVNADADEDELQKSFKPTTKAVFAESLSNPSLVVLDIEKFAKVAHKNNVPLIIDNTFPTPVLCRPFEHGADIVIHSTSKYMDGHALQVGGIIVDSGKFDWSNGYFPEFTEPDESYHGVVYTRDFGSAAYIVKARMQLMRDFGAYPSSHSAFLLNIGLETMPCRMEKHSQNADKVARFLQKSSKIESVCYPGLETDKYYGLARKYMPDGASGVIAVTVKGGSKNAMKFVNALKLISIEVHVADIRSCILHPASATHRQLSDEQLINAGVNPGMVRLSVGLENVSDIIADLEQSLNSL